MKMTTYFRLSAHPKPSLSVEIVAVMPLLGYGPGLGTHAVGAVLTPRDLGDFQQRKQLGRL
jgi:hypothetical protein